MVNKKPKTEKWSIVFFTVACISILLNYLAFLYGNTLSIIPFIFSVSILITKPLWWKSK